MRVSVYNDGPNPIRVTIDQDETSATALEPGDERMFDSRDEGTIELRELAGPLAHAPGEVEEDAVETLERETDAGNAAERAVHHEPGTT